MGEMDTTSLAERVLGRRQGLGMTRQQLADLAEVSDTQVYLVERGITRRMTRKNLKAYANALHVSSHWLATGEQEPDVNPVPFELAQKIGRLAPASVDALSGIADLILELEDALQDTGAMDATDEAGPRGIENQAG